MSHKRKQLDKLKNPVARYAHRFNKSAVFTDRKKEAKRNGYAGAHRAHLTTIEEY